MPKKISPELAAALKAEEADRRPHDAFAALPSEEWEVLRAARQHARLTNVSLWDVSTQIVNMTHGEAGARRVAEQAGIPWPQVPGFQFFGHPFCCGTSCAQDFVDGRWGDLLEAVVAAGRNPDRTDFNLFDSPTVRVILGMAREGTRSGRPEFEDVLRRVAAALTPPSFPGKRPTTSYVDEERLLHAAFLLRAFKAITEWAATLGPRRPRGAALVAFLKTDGANGLRPYSEAIAAQMAYIPGLRMHFEDELLSYVVQAVETPGKLSSARKAAFHAFAVAHGFAPQSSKPAPFLHALREHEKTVRDRERRTSGRQRPQVMRPDPKAPMLSTTGAQSATPAGRKRDRHDAHEHPPQARPQPPAPARRAAGLPPQRPRPPHGAVDLEAQEHGRRRLAPSDPPRSGDRRPGRRGRPPDGS